jgi:hypothetical protein
MRFTIVNSPGRTAIAMAPDLPCGAREFLRS